MTKTRTIPHYARMFLYRQGLKILPSQNFIEKFKEIYNELLYKNKIRHHIKPIDDNMAIFFINTVIESVIYCLDFGYDVWFSRTILFLQKKTDYRHNVKKHKNYTIEDVKKISIRAIKSMILKMKNKLNEQNEEYQKFLEHKKVQFKTIKDYYKKFYGKEDEWWQE